MFGDVRRWPKPHSLLDDNVTSPRRIAKPDVNAKGSPGAFLIYITLIIVIDDRGLTFLNPGQQRRWNYEKKKSSRGDFREWSIFIKLGSITIWKETKYRLTN